MIKCKNCGKQLTSKQQYSEQKYCSRFCWAKAKKKKYWKDTTKRKYFIVSECSTGETPKKHLIEQWGNKCIFCGKTKVIHPETKLKVPVPLILDHIDGNSSNWYLINLRLLCPTCDALLSTSKGKNRGKGRKYRRKEYIMKGLIYKNLKKIQDEFKLLETQETCYG